MRYIYNAWYAAAWEDEIGEELFARTLLEIPIVFFRENNSVIAMHDRCPHRFAPLSLGTRVDGAVRCGYHGLSFDSKGQCVKSLFSAVAPKAAKVRTFPIHEQDRVVWIWMGDPSLAHTGKIPHLPFHTDPALVCNFGYTHAKADYRLLSDNLMDLTHTALLHPDFGGLDYIPDYKCWEEEGDVISQYIIEHMPSFLEPGSGKLLHNHDKIRWLAPATHYLESRITPEGDSGRSVFIPSAHILTPETPATTHYFWSSAASVNSEAGKEVMRALLIKAFDHEDKPMVEAVQSRMGDVELWDLNPILLSTDAGSVRVRRRMSAMIADESAQTSAGTATGAQPR
jgi:phenylpropionate dioxygenase-like ring-hydroxylating dioxygenase large terminal subunit